LNAVTYLGVTLVQRSSTDVHGAPSGGFKVGGPEARLKRGAPLMTPSYSANRDKHFDQA